MKNILIANIGNSDLGKDNKPFFDLRKNEIYTKSKEMLKNRDFVGLEPIILKPIIEKIKEKGDLAKIYLFATKQEPPHSQDTIYIAQIIKELLKNEDIEIIKITDNPSDYDSMFKNYEYELNKIKDLVDNNYISITGGAPAENMSLLIKGLLKFGNKIRVVYKPGNSNETNEFKIGETIGKILLEREMKTLEKKHLYMAAANIGEKCDLLTPSEIKRFKAKEYRLLFDFNKSLKLLNEIKDGFAGEEKDGIIKEIEILESFKETKGTELNDEYFARCLNLINELYKNMKIKWEQGAYVDFVGRLFRFEEAVLRFIFEKEFKVNTEENENGKFPDFIKCIEDNSKLKEFLNQAKIEYEHPSRRTLYMVLNFYKKENAGREDIKEIQEIIKKIEKLADIRNKSILAHGFNGISETTIKEKYPKGLMEDLKNIVTLLNKSSQVFKENDK